MKRICANDGCQNVLEGRVDRKFCSDYCKSDHHYKKRKERGEVYFKKTVDDVLRTNRRILQEYNQAGKSWVRKEELLQNGFNPRFFTHFWKNHKKETYLFCYEQGFRETTDNDKQKYLLIQWQDYMEAQLF